ncbi:PDR/VanB family oxidoreductase [Nonomuraea sp. NPDC005650]|uniref:PDR/VanB family oxidoreductase n=1 Tax=Nonomuraea sp. NPDC005650 TaxID=3157045 RepID=UPI0033AF5EA4
MAVQLESMAGLDLPQWEPGAFIEVKLPSGRVRHYSLCGDPRERDVYRIAVLREEHGRGGSKELHEMAGAGAVLEVRPPRNNFALEPAAEYLFLAGGVGITPIVSMIRRAEQAAIPWRLVYGGRSRSWMAFADELLSLGGDRVALFADDVEGRPDLAAEMAKVPPDGLVYACGPAPMLDLVAGLSALRNAAQLRIERFSVAAVDIQGAPFHVELARTGVTVPVASNESILQAMRARGIPTSFSCENGYCGTCEAVVLDGEPDQRDTYLTEEEKSDGFTMMICVSRSAGPKLVLDL